MSDKFSILVLEDDEDDAFLLKRALTKNNIEEQVVILSNGLEGVDYLLGNGEYADRTRFPWPGFILLDLKMPRMGGLQFLEWIQTDPKLQLIPILVLSSSKEASDVERAYHLGANAYFTKPARFDETVELIRTIFDYWKKGIRPVK